MKVFKSLPTDSDFFSRYASLIPSIGHAGYVAQLISALTEAGILFVLIRATAADFLSPMLADVAGFLGATAGVLLIELGLRKLLPFSVRAVLHKRFSGLDLVMTFLIFAGSLVLLAASGFLSFQGSKDLVSELVPPPVERSAGLADTLHQAATMAALAAYRADSAMIERSSAQRAASIKAASKSAQTAIDVQLRALADKEAQTGQSFATRKADLRAKRADLAADRDRQLADLAADLAASLSAAAERRRESERAALEDRNAGRADVTAFNLDAKQKVERKVKRYGGGLAWLAAPIALFILIVSIILFEVHQKGSGIDENVEVDNSYFQPGKFSEAVRVFLERIDANVRTKIAQFEARTIPPPPPVEPPVLYQVDSRQSRKKVEYLDEENGDGDSIKIPRRRIGFFIDPNDTNADRYNGDRYGKEPSVENPTEKVKGCLHCGTTFPYKHWNARYCSEQCRIAAWEQRTGRTLNKQEMSKKRKRRK